MQRTRGDFRPRLFYFHRRPTVLFGASCWRRSYIASLSYSFRAATITALWCCWNSKICLRSVFDVIVLVGVLWCSSLLFCREAFKFAWRLAPSSLLAGHLLQLKLPELHLTPGLAQTNRTWGNNKSRHPDFTMFDQIVSCCYYLSK